MAASRIGRHRPPPPSSGTAEPAAMDGHSRAPPQREHDHRGDHDRNHHKGRQRRPADVIHHIDQGLHIPRSPSGSDARRPVWVNRWGRSVMRTTMRCARASSPRSNASCSTGGSSAPRRRPARSSSSSSRAGTILADATRRSAKIPINYERTAHARLESVSP